MKLFSQITGIILHPVILSLVGVFLIVDKVTGNVNEAYSWTFFSGLFAAFIGAFVLFGVKKGFFNNFDVSNRKQRVILYPFVIVTVIIFSIFVFLVNGPRILIDVGIYFAISLMLLDLINSKIKASIHVASVASLATGMIAMLGVSYFWIYLLVPISSYARIVGKRHTLKEAIVGAFCGIILTVLGIYIVQLL